MRKEDNREKYKEYDNRYYIKHRRPNSKIGKLETKISDLEAKLAEKERQLKLAEELLIKQEKEYDEQLEKQAKIHYRNIKEIDQDKISFAVEKLEQVKEHFINIKTPTLGVIRRYEMVMYIDTQINELKGKV